MKRGREGAASGRARGRAVRGVVRAEAELLG